MTKEVVLSKFLSSPRWFLKLEVFLPVRYKTVSNGTRQSVERYLDLGGGGTLRLCFVSVCPP